MALLKQLTHCLALPLAACSLLSACTGVPDGATPIASVDSARYQGTWYEIARFDHRFERGLECVTANYTPRDDGGIKVINAGFDPKKNKWSSAEGKAYFLNTPTDGRLKVSFFGPFYSGYNVLLLDEHYQYALVSGPNHDYLWILSRTPTLPQATYDMLIDTAKQQHFDTRQLLNVNQQLPVCAARPTN